MSTQSPSTLVSVVIPTFNRKSFLEAVISPLLTDPATGEIIVVVDGSRDGSIEFLEEWAGREPRVRPVFQENAGQAAARSRGAEEARFDVVLFLDDDVRAEDGLVSGHASRHAGETRRVALGYMPIRLPEPRRAGQAATILYARDYENTCQLYERDAGTIFTHFWAGNLSLGRVDAAVVCPPKGPRLPYHEDTQLGLRCRDAGLEPIFDRRLLASHVHVRDLSRFATECRRSAEGRARLIAEDPALGDELDPLTALSPVQAMVTRGLSVPLVRNIAGPATATLSKLSGRMGVWSLEVFFARVLRQIELYSAFRRATRSLATSP